MSKEIEQCELRDLLPGSAGGRALRRLKGREYFVELGRRGGKATRDRYGVEHLRRLSERGGEGTRRRYHTMPKTIRPWYGGEERRVPFWPPRSTKRRKRPVYVRIEIRAPSEEEIEEIVAPQIEKI